MAINYENLRSPSRGVSLSSPASYAGLQDDSSTDLVIESVGTGTIRIHRADNAAISGIVNPGSNDSVARRENAHAWLVSKGIAFLQATEGEAANTGGKYITLNANNDVAICEYVSAADRVSAGDNSVKNFTLVLKSHDGGLTPDGGKYLDNGADYIPTVGYNIDIVTGDVTRNQVDNNITDEGGNQLQFEKVSALDDDSFNDRMLTGISRKDGGALNFTGWNTGTFADKVNACETWYADNLEYLRADWTANDGGGDPDTSTRLGPFNVNGTHASYVSYMPANYFVDAGSDRAYVKTTTGDSTGDITHILIRLDTAGSEFENNEGVTGTSYDATTPTVTHTAGVNATDQDYAERKLLDLGFTQAEVDTIVN